MNPSFQCHKAKDAVCNSVDINREPGNIDGTIFFSALVDFIFGI